MHNERHNGESIALEATYLFKALFGSKPISNEIMYQYCQYCASIKDDNLKIKKIVDLKLDVEAIEIFLRLKNRKNTLTQRVHSLVYFAEIRGSYYSEFYQENDSFMRAFAILSLYTLRSIYKYFKGLTLVKIYGII